MSNLSLTPLNQLHIDLGAKMVPFAGFSMPVQYSDGIIKEHLFTRSHSAIFDVSHMGQILLSGKGIADALEKILPINVKDLKVGRQRYGFLTLENGGILDDLMLARIAEDEFYMVVNASRKTEDYAHFEQHLAGFNIHKMDDFALIAIQGPESANIVSTILPGVETMKFMDSQLFEIDSHTLRVSRSGYTGEDGYEISIPENYSIEFTQKLLAKGAKMAGLGARDSLRLEAGLCLYGNDIDESTTPTEADLLWAIQKIRKQGGERQGGFIGDEIILKQIEQGTSKKRVGFIVDAKAPVRAGTEIYNENNQVIGAITSGGMGISINKPIAMGYIDTQYSQNNTEVTAIVRKKKIKLTVAATPFVPQNYYRG